MATAYMTIVDTDRNNQDRKRMQAMRHHYAPMVAEELKLQMQAKKQKIVVDQLDRKE